MLIEHKLENIDCIGLTGFAQTGKDETGKILNKFGFSRVSLGDPLRKGIYNINPYVFVEYKTINHDVYKSIYQKFHTLTVRLQDIVDFIGWDEAKKIPEVRRLLQYYGTEGGREIFGDKIWIDTADKYIFDNQLKRIVITDIRFQNELEWLRNKDNNILIKIKREGVMPINSHISDRGIPDQLCDFIINNDGTINDLEQQINNIKIK